jgi:hypothetical protein
MRLPLDAFRPAADFGLPACLNHYHREVIDYLQEEKRVLPFRQNHQGIVPGADDPVRRKLIAEGRP